MDGTWQRYRWDMTGWDIGIRMGCHGGGNERSLQMFFSYSLIHFVTQY